MIKEGAVNLPQPPEQRERKGKWPIIGLYIPSVEKQIQDLVGELGGAIEERIETTWVDSWAATPLNKEEEVVMIADGDRFASGRMSKSGVHMDVDFANPVPATQLNLIFSNLIEATNKETLFIFLFPPRGKGRGRGRRKFLGHEEFLKDRKEQGQEISQVLLEKYRRNLAFINERLLVF